MKTLRLTMSSDPAPFVQPFLVLSFRKSAEQEKSRTTWHIDVNGEIGKYLHIDEHSISVDPESNNRLLCNGSIWMTPLLKQLVTELAGNGLHVAYLGSYHGSAGPSHILRNGALFERIS